MAQQPVHDHNPEWPISDIKDWVQGNMAKIDRVAALTGGWEGWAQVELALRIRKYTSAADREQRMFKKDYTIKNQTPRFDLWIPSNPQLTGCERNIGIELKVRLKDNTPSFKSRLMDDFQKVILNEGPKYATAQSPATTYVVGITHDQADVMAYAEALYYGTEGTKYYMKRVHDYDLGAMYYTPVNGWDDGNQVQTMYIVWWRQTWPNDK
jgi:hypothetical protein